MMLGSFHILICHLPLFFGEVSVHIFGPFSNWLVFLMLNIQNKFWIWSFIRYEICKYILPFCGLSFRIFNTVFYRTKVQWSPAYHFFSFMECIFGVISKNSSPNPKSDRFSPILSSRVLLFCALHLSLWSILSSFSYFYVRCSLLGTFAFLDGHLIVPLLAEWPHFLYII